MKRVFENRKTLYFVLVIMLVSIFTLSVAYAALSTVLKITGNAEVVASSWDIYLDNVNLYSGSVTSTAPTIIDKTTASFSTILTNPGDYYEFSIDVVNNGSIDAMIDSIEKTSLSEFQSKYLNYVVEYQTGESITTKQLVEADSFVRLKVKVEFRKDLVASDLPSTTENLTLSFTLKYVQASETGTSSIQNSGKIIKVVSGDGTQVGDEVCIQDECFYVISSTVDDVTMLAKYNLLVGNKFDDINGVVPIENATGIQDETAVAYFDGYSVRNPIIGTKEFSSSRYWSSTVNVYPAYVYNENSSVYEFVEKYKDYLVSLGVNINDARLIKVDELESLGCTTESTSCSSAPSWVSSTTYWSGEAYSVDFLWFVSFNGSFTFNFFSNVRTGIRPVIEISRNLL